VSKSIFFCISLVVSILIVWFRTNVAYEYYSALKLSGFKPLDKYKKIKQATGISQNFSEFTASQSTGFFTKLISCPTCLGFWLSTIVSALFTRTLWKIPQIFVGSLLTYHSLLCAIKNSK